MLAVGLCRCCRAGGAGAPAQPKQQLYNTDKDLRRKSMKELHAMLIDYGWAKRRLTDVAAGTIPLLFTRVPVACHPRAASVKPEDIPSRDRYGKRARWERVRMVIECSSQVLAGQEAMMSRALCFSVFASHRWRTD